MIERFIVSRDDAIYEAWPDVTLTRSGKLVCLFSECTHHGNRDYTRIMLTDSHDRGRTWSPKRPLTDALRGDPKVDPYWNCGRIVTLADGRLVAVCDRIAGRDEGQKGGEQSNWLWFSDDEGQTWSGPHETPVYGIVPDQLIELRTGRWLLSAHSVFDVRGDSLWRQRTWISDDQGKTWSDPHVVAAQPGLQLCEGSIVELPQGELVCFMRENSRAGLDCFKSFSFDGGETWDGPYHHAIPGCHRPVAGVLQSGDVMITHRYMHGGAGRWGWMQMNFFAAFTPVESCLEPDRAKQHVRIMPLDYDRSSQSDIGYSGWVQFDDGEIFVVYYIVDDAPNGHIRACAFGESDVLLSG